MKFWENKQVQLYAGSFLLGLGLIYIMKNVIKKDYSKYIWFNDPHTRSYYDKLHPKFKPKVAKFLTKVEEAGLKVYITSGFRSYQDQVKQYQQNPSNAKPGFSYHNFGLAIDVNIMQAGKIILRKSNSCEDWNLSGVVKLAKESGIEHPCKFGTYLDPVHFQWKPAGINTTILRDRVLNGQVDKNGYVLL